MAAPTVVMFHPDLGIGGAERLVIDAAMGLKSRGYKVTIFTSHCDPDHCFDEARNGSLDVRVRGNFLPPTIFGRFKILLTILRHYHLLLHICLLGELSSLNPAAFFIDQLSAGIPILRWWFPDTPILFYCHYPDLLLAQGRKTLLKRIWRWGFDLIEGWSMQGADRVVVNSNYTRSVVESVWKGLGGQRGIGIVYPCVDTEDPVKREQINQKPLWSDKSLILSINRFERKKDIDLAIRAFAHLNPSVRAQAKLVIAGGYDSRVQENVEYHQELIQLAESKGLRCATAKNIATALGIPNEMEVLFLLSVPAQLKNMLLSSAKLLVYTPTNEHFGIVPLEAMLAGVPVLTTNTGGPLETVVDGETGWLRAPEAPDQWTSVMQEIVDPNFSQKLKNMGEAGKQRVNKLFSNKEMARKLDQEIHDMRVAPRADVVELQDILLAIGMAGPMIAAVGLILLRAWEFSQK